MDQLPPLNALRVFEAAGRLRSIRSAATELSVTPGAVSRQVQVLERHLGLKLFRRIAREIVLTAEGEAYLKAVSRHLDGIRGATEALIGRRGAEVVRIDAHTTFAMKWLVPRLGSFQQAHPAAELRLSTSNEPVDFARASLEGMVRLGDGAWAGLEADRLMDSKLIPLCTPGFRRKHGLRRVQDLKGLRLLHSLVRPDDWRLWLEAAGARGIDPHAGDKFDTTMLAYHAALQGHGILVGHRALFEDDLQAKRLVQPFGPALDQGQTTYYLVYPRSRLRNPAFRRFRNWLLAELASETSGSVSSAAEVT